MKKIIVLTMASYLFLSTSAYGLDRFDIVTTEEMKQMLDARKAGKIEFVLVNGLDEMIFRSSSIPGSINVPLGRVEKMSHKLGKNKDMLIITY